MIDLASSSSCHQKSIFHTSEPRDTKTTIHLLLMFGCFISSIIVAIIFLETRARKNFMTAQTAVLSEEKSFTANLSNQ